MTTQRLLRYWASVIPGTEAIVIDELKEKLPGVRQVHAEGARRGSRVHFEYRQSPRKLLELYGVQSVSAVLQEWQDVTVGRPGLERLTAHMAGLDLTPAKRLARALRPETDTESFQLSVTLQGRHRFGPGELSAGIRTALAERQNVRAGGGPAVLQLQVHVQGRRALAGLRVWGQREKRLPTVLDSVLCYCLARVMSVGGSDTVLLVNASPKAAEVVRHVFGPGHLAVQLDHVMRDRALEGTRCRHGLICGDPDGLPVRGGAVDCVIGRFGNPVCGSAELAAAVRPGGAAAVVVPEARSWQAVLVRGHVPLQVLACLSIQLKGRQWSVLLLERVPTESGRQLLDIEVLPTT